MRRLAWGRLHVAACSMLHASRTKPPLDAQLPYTCVCRAGKDGSREGGLRAGQLRLKWEEACYRRLQQLVGGRPRAWLVR